MRGCGSEWRDAPRAHSSREDHRLPPAASQPAASQILPIYLSRVGAWRARAWRGATPPLSMLTRTLQERNERSRHHHPPLPHGIRAMHADGPRGSAPAAAPKNSGPSRARAGCHSCPVPMLRARPAGVRVHHTTGAAPRRRFRHLACASRDSGPDWCRRSTARPHEGASASVSTSSRATRRRVRCSPLPRRPVAHGPPWCADRACGARGGSCALGAGWLTRPRLPSQAAASGS